MKRIRNFLIMAAALMTALCAGAKTAWADSFTMADIAMMEYQGGFGGESVGSGIIRYSEWYNEQTAAETDPFKSGTGQKWDAVFACWCADQLGYIHRGCFPMTSSTSALLQWFVDSGYHMYSVKEFLSSGGTSIRAGDIVFVSSPENGTELTIGIVTAADSSMVSYVTGGADGTVCFCQKDISYGGENIVFFPVIPSEGDNYSEIVQFLDEKMNLNPAAICGIIANILYESNGMPTALGDNGTSYGICQWHEERWQQLINYCNDAGYDWESLDGQLMFLWYDLNCQFPELKNLLDACPDSSDGAYKAGYAFCLSYESPQDSSTKAEIRAAEAMYNVYPSLYA